MQSLKNIGVVIQARTGSTRLPGKMTMPFYENKALLDIILEKFEEFEYPVILATTINHSDDVLVDFALKHHIKYYRGSEDDVLQRFVDAANNNEFDVVVRVCADNPFISVEYIKQLIKRYNDMPANYISFKNKEGIPTIRTHYGFFAELVELFTLKEIIKLTEDHFFHEHVTNYIYSNQDYFKIDLLKLPFEENDRIRLTIDTLEDFNTCKEIYSELHSANLDIEPLTIINYLNNNPEYFNLMSNQIKNQTK